MRAGLQWLAGKRLRNNRRILRIHRNGFKSWFARFNHLHTAGDGAARPDTRDQNVHLAVRVGPNFLRRGLAMNFHIGRIFKLLRNPGVRRFLGELLRAGNRALHAFRAGRQNQLRPEHRQQRAAFHRHRFRHGQNDFVTLGRRDEGEGNAGVAACRLDDDGVFFEDAALLGVLNHRHADAILDAAERIEKFALEKNGSGQAGGDLVQFNQRGAPDGLDDVVVDASHKNPFQTRLIKLVSQDCDESGTRARGILFLIVPGCSWTLYLLLENTRLEAALTGSQGWLPPRGGGTLPSVPVRAASCRQQIQCSFATSFSFLGAANCNGVTPSSFSNPNFSITSTRTKDEDDSQKQTISPCPAFRSSRDKWGMGVRQALFPMPTLGAPLSGAVSFPTPFSTA